MSKETGGPAFPHHWVNDSNETKTAPNGTAVDPGCSTVLEGMTLRDYFAAKAMQGYLAAGATLNNCAGARPFNEREVSSGAYAMADAMLAERCK